MGAIELTPEFDVFRWGAVVLNSTILFTWVVMLVLFVLAKIATRQIEASAELPESGSVPRIQNMLESIVDAARNQIHAISQQDSSPYLPFIGTLFLFLAVSNLLAIVPGFTTPTASLSTTAALAACVFLAVPWFGIRKLGFKAYIGQYIKPSVLMLPFNLIGEASRTLALAVRLYGNMMSGGVIVAVLLSFLPLFVPVAAQAFGLLTGIIQAYIFSVLAMVYIASATRVPDVDDQSTATDSSQSVS